jgi:hypothetical protein
MSLIAMQGGATGTGTVTLLAPITNTNQTLTLPDATGTVATLGAQTFTGAQTFSLFPTISALSYVRVNTANGYGSTNTSIRRFTNVVNNVGTDITYADSATLGATFTINTAGVYSVSYVDNFGSVSNVGITINSTQLSTDIGAVSVGDRLAISTSPNVNHSVSTSAIFYATATSIIRAHTDGSATGLAGRQHFTIARVA